MSNPTTFREVIDLFVSRAALARKLHEPSSLVRLWYKRDSIPKWRRRAVAGVMKRAGFPEVTVDLLNQMTPGSARDIGTPDSAVSGAKETSHGS